MSWLLFMDESGHDHRQVPYEVRGGIALHASKLWSFVLSMQRAERDAFGTLLSEFRAELKGSHLLDKDRFKWARQDEIFEGAIRRRYSRAFLTKGLEKKSPIRNEFTAYGQACIQMADSVFRILQNHSAILFAAAIPRGVSKPDTYEAEEFLRKDQVFLLERYFYFLESKQDHGLLVMDEVDKNQDRQFVRRLESYFRNAGTGQARTRWIVPTPLFVSSDMAYPIQAADLCIYCINWGFRLPLRGMEAETRMEIADRYSPLLDNLQFRGESYRDGEVYPLYGIVFVPDPYTSRADKKRR